MKELLASIPVPPKMYRHFAAITVLLTACIALFADGEGQEAIRQEVSYQQNHSALREAEAEKMGPRKFAAPRLTINNGSGFGSEGPVAAAGTSADGAGGGVASTDGRNLVVRAENHDLGSMPPGFSNLGTGKPLPNGTVGPGYKPPRKQPSQAERARLEQAGAERAGMATPAE